MANAALLMELARASWVALEAGNPSQAQREICAAEVRRAEKAWLREAAPQLGSQQLERFIRNYERKRLRGETPPEYDVTTGHTAKRKKNSIQEGKRKQARKPYRWHPTFGFIQFLKLCQVHAQESEEEVLRRWEALPTVNKCFWNVREESI